MTSATEAAAAKSELAADLAAGVDFISRSQVICFTLYVRVVLPIDGFVFWVRSDLLSRPALIQAMAVSGIQLLDVSQMPPKINVKGSLHYSSVRQQAEDATVDVNTIIFTSIQEVLDFQRIGPNTVYIADGPKKMRFSFAQTRPFYQQADLYHYIGNAVYSTFGTQVIDSVDQFSTLQVISNSLPFWLSFNSYKLLYPGIGTPAFPLYPSFVVPDNIAPPFGTVHIDPRGTQPLQAVPYLDPSLTHYQLTKDTVRLTFFGVRNADALSFMDFFNQYSLDTDNLGLMNMPIVRDEKQEQTELNIIAMKKVLDYEVSYFQSTARTVSRQLIESAIPTIKVASAVFA